MTTGAGQGNPPQAASGNLVMNGELDMKNRDPNNLNPHVTVSNRLEILTNLTLMSL